jgi:methionyl-tRNA synthetase
VAWSIVARVDKMISDAKPWELAKDENQNQTLSAVLYRAAEALRWLCIMLYPVMPAATQEIWRQLNLSEKLAELDPAQLKWGELKEEAEIGEVKPIFPRLDKAKIMAEIEQKTEVRSQKSEVGTKQSETHSGQHATEADAVQGASSSEAKPAPPQPGATEGDAVPGAAGVANYIDITDFTKVELRVGQVLTAARIPKSDKLLLLTVDIGEAQPRQILAGIAEHYTPEEMVDRKIAVVANLKPRKMRGHESQGMLLAASVGDGDKPVLATFTEDVPNGARLK